MIQYGSGAKAEYGMIKILDDPKIKIDTIYGNDFDLKVLQSSKDKKKQSASTAKLIKYRDDEI